MVVGVFSFVLLSSVAFAPMVVVLISVLLLSSVVFVMVVILSDVKTSCERTE